MLAVSGTARHPRRLRNSGQSGHHCFIDAKRETTENGSASGREKHRGCPPKELSKAWLADKNWPTSTRNLYQKERIQIRSAFVKALYSLCNLNFKRHGRSHTQIPMPSPNWPELPNSDPKPYLKLPNRTFL